MPSTTIESQKPWLVAMLPAESFVFGLLDATIEHLLWQLESACCVDNVPLGFPKPVKKNNRSAARTTIASTIRIIVVIGKPCAFFVFIFSLFKSG